MRNVIIAAVVAISITGCANYDQKQVVETPAAKDAATEEANVAAANVEIAKVNPGEINLYIYYNDKTSSPNDKHKLSVIYGIDTSKNFELAHGQYRLHRLSAKPGRLGALAFCARGVEFTDKPPVQGDTYNPENYRAHALVNSVALPKDLEAGKSYVVEITPRCFLNRYAGGYQLSSASFTVRAERDVKRVVAQGASRE